MHPDDKVNRSNHIKLMRIDLNNKMDEFLQRGYFPTDMFVAVTVVQQMLESVLEEKLTPPQMEDLYIKSNGLAVEATHMFRKERKLAD